MISNFDHSENSVNISDDQFKLVCVELLKYGMLKEYLFNKAIEEICVNDSGSLLEKVDAIKSVYEAGDSLNKKFIDAMNNKTNQLEDIIQEDAYHEFKELIETAVYSVIIVNEESLANEIYLELDEEKFSIEEISSDLDEDQIIEIVQDIGPIFLSNVHPVVKQSILSIQGVTGISRPVFVNEGWMIIQLKHYNKPHDVSLNYRDIAMRKIEEEARVITEQSLELFKSSRDF